MLAYAVSWLAGSGAGLAGSEAGLAGSGAGLAGSTAAVISALGITAAVRAPATLGTWPARRAICPAGQR